MGTTTELLTAEELADCMRVRPSTIRLWGREGLIPVVKIGGTIRRYDFAEVIAALKARDTGDIGVSPTPDTRPIA